MTINKRAFLLGVAVSTPMAAYLTPMTEAHAFAGLSDDEFKLLRGYRERQIGEALELQTKGVHPPRKKSKRLVSSTAIDLMVDAEVSGKRGYEKLYRKPDWPEGDSGVTIGIGYDVGYDPADLKELKEDWADYISEKDIATLALALKVRGSKAKPMAESMASVDIPWDKADAQFLEVMLPRFTWMAENALPNTGSISDTSLGALVSLVQNRGPAFDAEDDRHVEMRLIRYLMDGKEFGKIPAAFRQMKHVWDNQPAIKNGMYARREAEAQLFEKGLKA